MEETDCASFFDQIDDLLDFPVEDVEAGLLPMNHREPFPSIWSTQPDTLPCSDEVFSNTKSSSDLSAELSVPLLQYEDIVQLEWLSTFVEDSFSGENLTINKLELPGKESGPPCHQTFHTASPVSVLDSSSSSCSSNKAAPLSPEALAPMGRCGRARSKRPRPATFNPRPAIQLISPSSSSAEAGNPMSVSPRESSSSENYGESRPVIKILKKVNKPELKKKRKIKLTVPMDRNHQENVASSQTVRKCLHCEITKTPQWRAGPLGPKTLCNACGVRYKSGRLFPEYRPAASPTFVPSLHSNSHKKVIEMRSMGGEPGGPTGLENAMIPSEIVPNTTVARDDYI